jgi:hypothetical protein
MVSSCADTAKYDNQLTEQEKKEGWVLLFDGRSTKGWHLYNDDKRPSTWSVSNGELICGPDIRFDHMDLVTDKEYKNFDLRFDWKINKGGNSGVFINVVERPDIPATWASGPEYQMLEGSHPDYSDPLKRSGGIFGLVPQKNPVDTTHFGVWNESRIRQKDGRVEFYLNGILTVQQDLASKAWIDTITRTHFNNFPGFGRQTSGRIALQDWQKAVAFKNIKIREL